MRDHQRSDRQQTLRQRRLVQQSLVVLLFLGRATISRRSLDVVFGVGVVNVRRSLGAVELAEVAKPFRSLEVVVAVVVLAVVRLYKFECGREKRGE